MDNKWDHSKLPSLLWFLITAIETGSPCLNLLKLIHVNCYPYLKSVYSLLMWFHRQVNVPDNKIYGKGEIISDWQVEKRYPGGKVALKAQSLPHCSRNLYLVQLNGSHYRLGIHPVNKLPVNHIYIGVDLYTEQWTDYHTKRKQGQEDHLAMFQCYCPCQIKKGKQGPMSSMNRTWS